jgi:hypothetical protein
MRTVRLAESPDGGMALAGRRIADPLLNPEVRKGGETTGADLRLIRGAVIEGSVKADAGEPVANLPLMVDTKGSSWFNGGVNDAQGEFRFHVPGGERRRYVQHSFPASSR